MNMFEAYESHDKQVKHEIVMRIKPGFCTVGQWQYKIKTSQQPSFAMTYLTKQSFWAIENNWVLGPTFEFEVDLLFLDFTYSLNSLSTVCDDKTGESSIRRTRK